MKKLLLFICSAVLIMSCGRGSQQPTDYITFGQAFSHVSQSFNYWFFVILSSLALIVYVPMANKLNRKGTSGKGLSIVFFALLVLCAFAWLYRPAEVAANTTVEQMLRGVYIGY